MLMKSLLDGTRAISMAAVTVYREFAALHRI
jgi:hypothetical protein